MPPATALIVTGDDALLEDLLRLGAASGAVLEVAHDTTSAIRSWPAPAVVLVGADQASALAARRPPRREHVHVVGHAPVPDDLFRFALALGAQNVIELPRADGWVVEMLTDAADGGAGKALTVGVVGGCGGAGATTLACALGLVAAAGAPAALVDLDPLGPGVDRVVGLDEAAGVRWDALLGSSGRLGARSLRDALPRRDDLGVLTWGTGSGGDLDGAVLGEVLSAAQRGHVVVVLDLPRHARGVTDQALTHCDHVLVVSGLRLPAVASAARVTDRLREATHSLHLVTRDPGPGAADPEQVADMLGLPLLAAMGEQRRLAEHVDLGLGPVHHGRGALARAARSVLASLAAPRGVA